jgi:hypothetical protein
VPVGENKQFEQFKELFSLGFGHSVQ